MTRDHDAYRSFLKRLPFALATAMLLWLLLLRPALDVAVPRLTQLLIRAFEYPRVTRLVTADHQTEVRRSDFRSDSAAPAIPLTQIHFNTIILLTLHLASGRPFSRVQLERLLMAGSVLYLTQSLNLLFHVKCLYAFSMGEWSLQTYSDVARNVYGFLRYFTDLPGRFSFPFLLWLGFNWDQVAVLTGARAEEATTRHKRQ